VLAFAFLAASTAARNSDLWQHLAAGRLLAERNFHFGADPFAYTTEGAYWVNHSWLLDLGLYGAYRLDASGATLVVLKAIGVVALAFLLLNVRRRGSAAWPSAVCTALALLAMNPRLLLQPACASYLLLAVTLWLLWHIHTGARERPLHLVLVPLLCAVWVNVDGWFLLGPALVALFWLGEVIQSVCARGSQRPPRNVPGWLVPVALAACLLNPYGYHVFTMPAELSPWLAGTGLTDDARFRGLFGSPWRQGAFLRQAADFQLAAWAYFTLVALGLVSFALNRQGLRDWRGLTFAAFGLLAAWQVRAVPFFAVVAAPVTALNFQAALAGRPAPAGPRRVGGRLGLVGAGLLLLFAAWTGWPQAASREGRRVGWGVQADPSLQRVAETLADWRAHGVFRDGERGFAFHPAVADYCAWFAPAEKGFLDHRFALFPPAVLREYEEVCRALSPARGDGEGGDWRRVLRERGVRYLVLYDPDLRRLAGPLRRLHVDSADWALLRIDGRALVFAWRDGGKSDVLRFDPARLAFGPQDEEARAVLPAAPGEGAARPPQPYDSWARFLRPAAPPTWEAPAAAMYLRQFEEGARDLLWARYAGLVGLPAQRAGALLRLAGEWSVPGALDALPPALPLLAVRAGRRAAAANPDDADAWLVLGQAYLALARFTGEGSADGRRPLLGQVRHAQAATALENALRRNPDLLPAHQALAALYVERNCLDAALDHRRAVRDLTRQLGPAPGEDRERFAARLGRLEKDADELEQAVQDRENQYAVRTQGLGASEPLGRARAAVALGLARKALDDVLLPSQDVLFGPDGARLELELLLLLGRADRVREMLGEPTWDEQTKRNLGAYELVTVGPGGAPQAYRLPAYDWLRACQAAATGDYDLAGDSLGAAGRQLAAGEGQVASLRRPLARVLAIEVGLGGTACLLLPLPVCYLHSPLAGMFVQAQALGAEQADLAVLAGLLALERGDPAAAAGHFRAALGRAPDFAGRPLALAYLGRLRQAGAAP
jgi:tetratricopeptide (TPR) repeat protein